MNLHNYIHWLDYGVKGQKRGQHYNVLKFRSKGWKDYGVRGMKKGKHEMARDPEYLKRLKGLNGASVSNVNYSQAGLDNTFNRNAINKRKALENEAIRNGLTHKEANRLVKLNKRTKNILGMKKNVATNRAQRAKEMAAYNEEMGKYKKNQKLLNLGITSNVMSKPELPKSVAEHNAAGERRRAQKISNANQRAAKQAQYANVRNELSSKAERPAGYKQKSMLSRIGSGLSKHKGKAALAGLGLAAIGSGLGYAKHRGAFDSYYNVLKLKRNDGMNTYQKIKFLKFRRHMDAMRIKRLRRFGDISTGVAIVGGIVGGSALGLLLAKIMDRLGYEADIAAIREGSAIPEKEYVRRFKIYFNGGHGLFRKFMNPGVYSGMTDVDFYDYANKVNRAKTVSDLCVLFPKHDQLRRIAAAYKEARASGLY